MTPVRHHIQYACSDFHASLAKRSMVEYMGIPGWSTEPRNLQHATIYLALRW